LRRIFSLARKLEFRSLLIEEIRETECSLLAEENAALRLRQPAFKSSQIHRISFFRSPKDQAPAPQDYIGYVVFKSDTFAACPAPEDHIFESVMPAPRQTEQNNFVHCFRDYQVQTAAGTFKVKGVLYAQQNDLTFVCAHVALRSALACVLPEGDIAYARINSLAGIDHQSKKVGEGAGMGPDEMEQVLTQLGVSFQRVIHEPKSNARLPTEFQRDLYGLIESGCPALVGFKFKGRKRAPKPPPRHIIPVLGHTFNEDAWVPEAQRAYFGSKLSYYPSESWMSAYVVHDDNFGPYYCLPRHFLKKEDFRIILGLKRHPTILSAVQAEAVGLGSIKAIVGRLPRLGMDWYDRFAVYQENGWLVLRTILVEKDTYLGHLSTLRDWAGKTFEEPHITQLQTDLPAYFWLVEASAPELFSASRRKFGELLLCAQTTPPKPVGISILLAARLPGIVLFKKQDEVTIARTELKGHTELLSLCQRSPANPC
jgi:hypothetical protein